MRPVFTTVIGCAVVIAGLASTFIVSRVACVEKLNDSTTFAGIDPERLSRNLQLRAGQLAEPVERRVGDARAAWAAPL